MFVWCHMRDTPQGMSGWHHLPEIPNSHINTGLCGSRHMFPKGVHDKAGCYFMKTDHVKVKIFDLKQAKSCANFVCQQKVSLKNDGVRGDASNGRIPANNTYVPIFR